jgi:hypothetical protein
MLNRMPTSLLTYKILPLIDHAFYRGFDAQDYTVTSDNMLVNRYGAPLVNSNFRGVVLCHATPTGAGGFRQGLNRTIQMYRDAGYSFVTVRMVRV